MSSFCQEPRFAFSINLLAVARAEPALRKRLSRGRPCSWLLQPPVPGSLQRGISCQATARAGGRRALLTGLQHGSQLGQQELKITAGSSALEVQHCLPAGPVPSRAPSPSPVLTRGALQYQSVSWSWKTGTS